MRDIRNNVRVLSIYGDGEYERRAVRQCPLILRT